jgi:hypothetical protein
MGGTGVTEIECLSADTATWGKLFVSLNHSDGSNPIYTLQVTTTLVSIGTDLHVQGNYSGAGAKYFRVPHPLVEGKDLLHACLEGPENGVFYRGEVVIVNGIAEVTLPDYFEALTFPDDRSVLLTQILTNEEDDLCLLAATRVSNGRFKIKSNLPNVTVAWEIKAVRRIGVDRLVPIADRLEVSEHPDENKAVV